MTDTPPLSDEIEVSVFGPGVGESTLVHLGDGRWLAVDCCIDRESGKPAAIAYLESLGVDPSQAICTILTTHWHDDHIRGMSELVRTASSADFFCAGALVQKEFIALVAAFNKDRLSKFSGGAREIYNVYSELKSSGRQIRTTGVDRTIWRCTADNFSHGQACEIVTLSPSDAQQLQFLMSIGSITQLAGVTKFRAVADDPNWVSAACQIVIGEISVLLGADLEKMPDPALGWNAVVSSQGRPQVKSQIFKIPHHGSKNAHCSDVWSEMLEANTHSIVTPFTRIRSALPSTDDINRIKSHTNNLFITSAAKVSSSIPRLDRTVAKIAANNGVKFFSSPLRAGRVTMRQKIGGALSVSLYNEAAQL